MLPKQRLLFMIFPVSQSAKEYRPMGTDPRAQARAPWHFHTPPDYILTPPAQQRPRVTDLRPGLAVCPPESPPWPQ